MSTPEGIVQNKIINYLKKLRNEGKPIYWEKRQAGGFNYHKGASDLWIVYNGTHFEIEIKAKNGTQSSMQYLWQSEFKKINIDCYLVSSIEDAKEVIDNKINDIMNCKENTK